jgi:serine/threonine protein kinase
METLKILEKVHQSGYIYGDLKLDNILVGEGQTLPNQFTNPELDVFEKVSLHLIDFGFATRYVDRITGEHFQ